MARAVAVRDWLVGEARFINDADTVTAGFAERLVAAGLPLDRMMSAMPTLFATRRGLGRYWERGVGVRSADFQWGNQHIYEKSPFHAAHQTGEWVSFRLSEVADEDYTVVPDLRADGYTHFVCIPITFHDGDSVGGMTFSTRHADGFSDEHLAMLASVEPAMAMLLDLKRLQRLLNETLQMYVGLEPRQRILSGNVRRGEIVPIRAAIVFADMRGFTALSSTMTAEETTALLNRYFDCVVPPVEARGGQVLKYIGDGVLAIFHTDEDDEAACRSALEAAGDILAAIDRDRADTATEPDFDIKMSLHLGEVAYGNIGSGARLDYTVVGSDVNLASRMADLAGNLDRRILVSAGFADRLADAVFDACGAHELKGVAGPQAVFEPKF